MGSHYAMEAALAWSILWGTRVLCDINAMHEHSTIHTSRKHSKDQLFQGQRRMGRNAYLESGDVAHSSLSSQCYAFLNPAVKSQPAHYQSKNFL